jgi:hypothetical protein
MSTNAVDKPNPPIVEILWVDSCREEGWVDEEDFIKRASDEHYQDCYAAGFLVREDSLTVSVSVGVTIVDKKTGERNFHGVLTIPRGAIKEMRLLLPQNIENTVLP